ncbi:MAG TPA: MoxR family ATPase [Methanomassiliicoccales archaeon]|nr:MoxR family ATPase [Methanomassiliicoccales archaeon]
MEREGEAVEIKEFKSLSREFIDVIGGLFVSDETVVRKTLSAALANGHVLFEDMPGLGKTLLAKSFAKASGCRWSRVQFTPDIMPADILGTRIWVPRSGEFVLEKGPIFTNILLADEINRAPPKTQSALLEAMEERQVTIEGNTLTLTRPFFVIATQNPIEHEGTFPLPEAQMDRFLLRMRTGYVKDLDSEMEILNRRVRWRSEDPVADLRPVVSQERFVEMQAVVEESIFVHPVLISYICQLVRATREHFAVEAGSSPRGSLALMKLSRAHAAIMGRDFVTPDDVKLFALEALSHRIILKMEYEVEGEITPAQVVEEVLKGVEVPKDFGR